MKRFSSLKFLVGLCIYVVPHPVFGSLEDLYTLTEEPTTLPTTTPAATLCDTEYSCLNCTTARVCAPLKDGITLQEVYKVPCSGSTPWCSGGNCVSSEPEECTKPTPVPQLFMCMRDGYFPDLNDCSRYYQCVGGLPYLQECPGSTPYYYPDRQKCFGSGYQGFCADEVNPCSGYSGVKQAIGGSKKYFVYCVNGSPVSVDRCIGGHTFASGSSSCAPSCLHAGAFPDDEDCAKYYLCTVKTSTPAGTTYNIISDLTCPAGQGFLGEAFQCVDRSLVPNCNVSSSSLFN